MPRRRPQDEPLRSHTGVPLTRAVAFKFAADFTLDQQAMARAHAGAARYAFNHHLARVKDNLDARTAEREAGVASEAMTASLSWSKFSFIDHFTKWKNGKLDTSPTNEDGTRGLAWRGEVSADVFECASVAAAQALANFAGARNGVRAGGAVGFPRFKSRHRTPPAFRLRNRAAPGATQAIRVAGPKALVLPRFGEVRIHGCTRQVRRMLERCRLHLYAASVRFEKGRWWITLTGLAAEFHHERRSPRGRHPHPAGMDRGVKALAVVADVEGDVLHVVEGVNALQHAQQQLRRANKALARTKPGSNGRRKAKDRLTRLHARVGYLRADVAHQLTHWCATQLTSLTVEDLNVAGMVQLRTLARAVSDAGMGDVGRMLVYKARWYGLELHQADRWYPSSKTCSTCGHVKPSLGLDERTYRCETCGLVLDRDVNAAINLARWPDQQPPPARLAA